MNYQAIDDLLLTKSQADMIVFQLNSFKETLYLTEGSLAEKADRYLPHSLKESLGEMPGSSQDVIGLIENVCSHVNSLPVLTMILPFEPTASSLKKIINWIEINVKRKILIKAVRCNLSEAAARVEFEGRQATL